MPWWNLPATAWKKFWPSGRPACITTTPSTSSTPPVPRGSPKGATLSHSNILNNAFFIGEACAYTEEDRVCIPVPLYHCFGMVLGTLACTTHGSAIILPGPGFNPEEVLTTVQGERCTSLYGVPTMFIAELAHPDLNSFDLSSLRTGIMAGSPCPVEVMKQVISDMNMTGRDHRLRHD